MDAPAKVPVKQAAAPSGPVPTVFGSLQREIDRLFEDFSPALSFGRSLPDVRCRMDLAETKDGLELTVEVPGLDEKDVLVTVADHRLTVSGEKKFGSEQKDRNYHFVERGYGSFSRSIELPEGVKPEDIKATLNKGVLKVIAPTPAKSQPAKIEVRTGA